MMSFLLFFPSFFFLHHIVNPFIGLCPCIGTWRRTSVDLGIHFGCQSQEGSGQWAQMCQYLDYSDEWLLTVCVSVVLGLQHFLSAAVWSLKVRESVCLSVPLFWFNFYCAEVLLLACPGQTPRLTIVKTKDLFVKAQSDQCRCMQSSLSLQRPWWHVDYSCVYMAAPFIFIMS